MLFTVGKALKMNIFAGCRLLTGQPGLNNEIHSVNIIEILDDLRHIEPGEFLITTAHGLETSSEGRRLKMLDLLKNRKIAAMAIQTGHYLESIPLSLVRYLRDCDIPLIEIPPEISFKKLTGALTSELVLHRTGPEEVADLSRDQVKLMARLKEMMSIWSGLVEGDNPEIFYTELKFFGISPGDPYQVLLLHFNSGEAGRETYSPNTGAGPDLSVIQTAAKILSQRRVPFIAGPAGRDTGLLVQLERTLVKEPARAGKMAADIYSELNMLLPGGEVTMGFGSIHSSINKFRTALNEAKKALQAARLNLLKNNGPVAYNRLGLYRLIMEVDSTETLQQIYKETMAPLLDYDRRNRGTLLKTMKVFLAEMNIKKAAEKIFVHRHTLKYRLGQVEKMTGYNPLLPPDALQLNLGLHIYEYLNTLGIMNSESGN